MITLLASVPELRYMANHIGDGVIMDAIHWTARHFGWEGAELEAISGARERIFGNAPDQAVPDDPWLEPLRDDDSPGRPDGTRREAAEDG